MTRQQGDTMGYSSSTVGRIYMEYIPVYRLLQVFGADSSRYQTCQKSEDRAASGHSGCDYYYDPNI